MLGLKQTFEEKTDQMSTQPDEATQATWNQRFFAWLLGTVSPKAAWRFEPLKQHIFSEAGSKPHGVVLEIGIGAAPNFKYYSDNATKIIGIDPNTATFWYAKEQAKKINMPPEKLDLRIGTAENIPLEANSVDSIICTHVLCSVKDPSRAVQEFKRVLKPNGKLYFMEHVAAKPDSRLRAVQHYVRPLTCRMGEGCDITRNTADTLHKAGFSSVELQSVDLEMPRVVGIFSPHVYGVCVK